MQERTIKYIEMESPIGPLVLGATAEGLCRVEFGRWADAKAGLREWSERWLGTREWVPGREALAAAEAQLTEYFRGERQVFDLLLDLRGTPFQTKVWHALTDIPYGGICSYKDIGRAIGSEKAVRAVGGANNRNPVPVIVPCHRVIGADGAMVGYGGGLDVKTFLLRLEGSIMI
ncbi:Methylated-DNA--protein-cysteine methyltransferase, constitutive [Paenibacillus konkukensis]|uniref:Methylated-DNA--protein-cysteine methyltransferase n=2 Tax=Paenibacillus konkukensis TaxID=2020716 RepID=A0ABY4RQJ7_9BACL|nr:Methylated-DNA--protein-cysteine methyltransferase, constitutive [Paenibacillus konkukensis]